MNTQRIGNVAPIAFSGQGANLGTSSLSVITYDTATTNTEEVLNLNNGVFTAPRRGIYALSISLFLKRQIPGGYSGYFRGHVYKNGAQIYQLIDTISRYNGHNFAFFWMEILEAGDTIKIAGESVKSGSGNLNVFSGFLL